MSYILSTLLHLAYDLYPILFCRATGDISDPYIDWLHQLTSARPPHPALTAHSPTSAHPPHTKPHKKHRKAPSPKMQKKVSGNM